MTNGAFQSSQSSQSSQYNEKHGRKLILEVRREGTIDEEAISVLSVLRGVISKLRRLQFLFFFLYSIFCLEFGRRRRVNGAAISAQAAPQGGQPSRMVGMCVRLGLGLA